MTAFPKWSIVWALAASCLVGCGPMDQGGSSGSPGSALQALTTSSEGWLEYNGTWLTCGDGCANTGGTGTNAEGTLTQGITSPNMGDGGHSMKTYVKGTAGYQNKYWYIQRYAADGAPSTRITNATYDLYFYIPSAYVSTYQAIEFELQQNVNGKKYNMGWQYLRRTGEWRIFDIADHVWRSSGIVFRPTGSSSAPLKGDTWYHITADYSTTSTQVYHDKLIISDGSHTWTYTRGTPPFTSGTPNGTEATSSTLQWNNAVQLDTNSNGDAYSVYWDNIRVTWTY